MAEIEIERGRLDDADFAALVHEVEALGHEIQPSETEHILKAAWWVLVLNWVSEHVSQEAAGAVVAAAAAWARRWFRGRGKEPPRRIDLYGPDGKVVASVDLPEDDENSAT